MKALKRILAVALALAVTSCHAFITGPALWSHNSSSAFDAFIGLWVVNIIGLVWACIVPLESQRKE